jgi:hypothetical protein
VSSDLDLHGLVRIRVVDDGGADAEQATLRAVRRQVGPLPLVERDERQPDVVVRVVDRLPVPGGDRLRYLGLHDAAFDEHGLYVLGSKQRPHARARVPFDASDDEPFELLVERGFRAVPLLIAFVNLAALRRDVLPLHASAFVVGDTGVVVTGWSKGGKTEALLGFLTAGATYVGDEWLYLPPGGATVHGIPQPVTVWDWQIRQLPAIEAALTRNERTRLGLLRSAARLERFAPPSGPGYSGDTWVGAELVGGILPIVSRRRHVNIGPDRLPGGRPLRTSAPFDRLFLIASEEPDGVTVSPIEPAEIAARMGASLRFERTPVLEWYERWRFAFPRGACAVIDGAAEREARLLTAAFEGKPAYAVAHPYPVSLRRLEAAMRPYC